MKQTPSPVPNKRKSPAKKIQESSDSSSEDDKPLAQRKLSPKSTKNDASDSEDDVPLVNSLFFLKKNSLFPSNPINLFTIYVGQEKDCCCKEGS